MRVLVTGGAGFIGSNVADRLLSEGHAVTVLDNFDPYYDPEQKRRNVRRALSRGNYQLIEGDVRDANELERTFDAASPEVVIHLAAKAGVRASTLDPVSYVAVNELGGLHVLAACQRRGNVPIVYASTSSVYGSTAPVPFREDDPAQSPLSPYAASKRAGELMAHAFFNIYRQPAAILRFFTVYGPRGRPDMAMWTYTRAIRSGTAIRLHGENTERDFTYVADIVDGVVGAMHWVLRTRGFDTFNLGRSEPVRVRQLIEQLAERLGRSPNVVLGELQPGESPVTAADVDKANAAFGYAPRVSLKEGIEKWVEWVDNSDEAPPFLD